MAIINYLEKLVMECPYLKEFYEEVSEEDGYSLKEVPIIKQVKNSSMKSFGFIFTANKGCDIGAVENLIDIEFHKHLLLYLKRRLRRFGIRDGNENRKVMSIEASLSAEASEKEVWNYIYQINFVLTYM